MDLREELGQALDGVSDEGTGTEGVAPTAVESGTEPPAETATPTETPASEPKADGRARDEHGRFLPKSDIPGEPDKTAQPSQPSAPTGAETPKTAETPAPGVDLPPSTWTALAKAEYAKLPEVVRNEIKKRETDFQKGIGQYKAAADFGTRIDGALRPYAQVIREAGGTPEGVISNLLQTAYTLRTGTPEQKKQLLMSVAQQYGVNLGGQPSETPQGGVDQNSIAQVVQQLLQPHLQKFDQFSTQFTSTQQQREQQEQQQLANQIEAFRTATDEKGQPKHVYFDNVRNTMAALLDSGDAQSMDQAYEMACRAHPEVSRILSAEQRSKDEAQRLVEQRRLAEEAKRNTLANAQGQGGVGIADTSKVSLRDELAGRLEGRIA